MTALSSHKNVQVGNPVEKPSTCKPTTLKRETLTPANLNARTYGTEGTEALKPQCCLAQEIFML